MIPKTIHYCWFGKKPLPPLAKKCIASWKKFFPDYEIIEWNEDNFDVNQIPYTAEAYKHKKYAFVSDYARFKILYEHGGLYFDTDVEIIKPMNDIISQGNFMGLERDISSGFACAPGLGIGCMPQSSFFNIILSLYNTLSFENPDGSLNLKTVVEYTSNLMVQEGIELHEGVIDFMDFKIYPKDYFCPKASEFDKIRITENTRTIHHYAASWISKKQRVANFFIRIFGEKLILKLWNFTQKKNKT